MQGNIVRKIEQAFTAQTGESEMEMKAASDLAGNLYLLGSFNRLVLKFDREGKFITRMGGEGDQPGQFTFPDDIAVDSTGRVYISEGLNVAIFDPNGRYVDSFRPAGVASGLFVNENDELLIAARSQVLKYKLQ
jgi:sugar lactone lactonase YvrE